MERLKIKKIILKIGILAILAMIVLPTALALAANEYTVLAPLPGTTIKENCVAGDPECKTTLEKYVPGMFKLLIGLSAVAAVLMIVVGGFQYISSDAIQGKSEGKERIKNAVLGLVLVISAWLILNTINPNLLKFSLDISSVTTVAPAGTLSVTGATINLNTKDQLLTQSQASKALTDNGFTFSSTQKDQGQTYCSDRTNGNCTSVDQMHSDTVAGLVALKTACGATCSNLVMTGGSETGHAECKDPATCLPHSYGFKADVSNTQGNGAAFEKFIGQQVQAQNNGAPMALNGFYNISVGGVNYQVHPEGNHMDITVIPKK